MIRTNDTDTCEIYDAASSVNIILREFHSVSKPIGIRQKILFVHCIRKKYQLPRVVRMTMEHIFGKEQSKKIFKVAFGETKTKVISARVCKVDASGSLHVNERETERKGATYKKNKY